MAGHEGPRLPGAGINRAGVSHSRKVHQKPVEVHKSQVTKNKRGITIRSL